MRPESAEDPHWLDWAKRLGAIAQAGLLYSTNPFDRSRFEQVRQIASEIVAGGRLDVDRAREIFVLEAGYPTPKIDVRGVVFRDDRILLVRDAVDGGWTLPGGWADVAETLSAGVVREVREESGFVVRATRLLAIYDRSRHGHLPEFLFHVYKHFVLCEIESETGDFDRAEVSAVDFFGQGDLPPLSQSRVTEWQISRMFELRSHPDWPPDLD